MLFYLNCLSSFCYFSNLIAYLANISWSEVPRLDFDTNFEVDVVIVVASVEMVIFSLERDCLFVEGYIMMNIEFVRLVNCSVFI